MSKAELMLAPDISFLIHFVRTRRVILDADLARVYGVPTKALNQAVKRNISRFPADFMFRLNLAEGENLMRSQFVTASPDTPTADTSKRNIRHLPYAFTEQGALMAANILNSPRAVAMSVYVIRAFVKMREDVAANAAIPQPLLSAALGNHVQHARFLLPDQLRLAGDKPHGHRAHELAAG